IRPAPVDERFLTQAHCALRKTYSMAALGDLLVFIWLVGCHEVVDSLRASRPAGDGRHRFRSGLDEDDLAPETIDAVARPDCHSAFSSFTRHRETDTDAPSMQAAVVQPAQLAVRPLQLGEICRSQPLAREERDAFQVRYIDFF